MYLRGQHLLGQPRASGDHNWELDVFLANYPGDVVEVSVKNNIITCISKNILKCSLGWGLLELKD